MWPDTHCIHTVERMRSYAGQTTPKCVLSDWISVRPGCVLGAHLYLSMPGLNRNLVMSQIFNLIAAPDELNIMVMYPVVKYLFILVEIFHSKTTNVHFLVDQ